MNPRPVKRSPSNRRLDQNHVSGPKGSRTLHLINMYETWRRHGLVAQRSSFPMRSASSREVKGEHAHLFISRSRTDIRYGTQPRPEKEQISMTKNMNAPQTAKPMTLIPYLTPSDVGELLKFLAAEHPRRAEAFDIASAALIEKGFDLRELFSLNPDHQHDTSITE